MKKRLTNVQKIAITAGLCVLMIGCSYVGVNFTIGKSIDSLVANNRELQSEYDNLLTYVQNKQRYLIDADKYAEGSRQIVAKYPNNASETAITYEFERWWDDVGGNGDKYELETSSLTFSQGKTELATIYIEDDTYVWNKSNMALSYRVEYDNFKKFMDDVYDMQYGLTPTAITISTDRMDDKNYLVGSINFDINFIDGSTNEDITEPVIDSKTGINSVFFGGEAERKRPDVDNGEVGDSPIQIGTNVAQGDNE